MGQVYLNNSNMFTVTGLKDVRPAPLGIGYLNSAVVTGTLLDSTGTPLANASITATYLAGSNGSYIGIFPTAVLLVRGQKYTLRIHASQSGFDWESDTVVSAVDNPGTPAAPT